MLPRDAPSGAAARAPLSHASTSPADPLPPGRPVLLFWGMGETTVDKRQKVRTGMPFLSVVN